MLARLHKAMEEREEGFTLIELLVVIIIIGILAAIAIPLFLSQKNKAYESSVKSDLHQLATSIVSAQTDDPGSVTLTGSTGSVSVKSFASTDGSGTATGTDTVGLSTGNSLDSSSTSPITTDTWCVAIKSSKANVTWHISSDAATNTQTLASGACTAA